MSNTIKFKRGAKANLPTLSAGEPAFTTDTNDMYIGNGTSNIKYAKDSDINSVYTTTNSGNVYSVTIPNITSLDDGHLYVIKFNAASTGAVTLNINSLGAKSIIDYSGSAVTDVRANLIVNLRYEANTGSFILLGKGGGNVGTSQNAETDAINVITLTNILANSSFENDTANWIYGTHTASILSSGGKYGTKHLKLVATTASTTNDGFSQNLIPAKYGHIYYAYGWLKSDSNTGVAYCGVTVSSADTWTNLSSYNNITLDNTWRRASIVFTNTSTATDGALKFRTRMYNSSGLTIDTSSYEVDACGLIDLTSAFGSGNEPTVSEMNTILDSLSGYFDGTKIVASIPKGNYVTDGFSNYPDVIVSSSEKGPTTKVSKTTALINVISNGSFEDGTTTNWGTPTNGGTMGISSSISKFGSKSMSVLGSVSYSETYFRYANISYTQGHKYYCSAWVYSNTANKSAQIYFPETTPYPYTIVSCVSANTWYHMSFISQDSTIADGIYSFRLDNDNVSTATTMYYDGIVCIDLTASYGSGNEPTKEQMDDILNNFGGFFDGTTIVNSILGGAYLNSGATGSPEVLVNDTNLIPSKIISSYPILGVTGTIVDRAGTSTTCMASSTSGTGILYLRPQAGYYDGISGTSTQITDSNFISANIKAGTTVLGVTGATNVVDTSAGNLVTGAILTGYQGYSDGALVAGTLADNYSTDNITASTVVSGTTLKMTVPTTARYRAGYHLQATDADFIASNIISGKNIFGLAGNAQIKTYAYGTVVIPSYSYPNITVPVGFQPSFVYLWFGNATSSSEPFMAMDVGGTWNVKWYDHDQYSVWNASGTATITRSSTGFTISGVNYSSISNRTLNYVCG